MKKRLTTLFLYLVTLCTICISHKTQIFAYTSVSDNNTVPKENKISCYNDLTEACALGGTYMLTDSISLENSITIPSGVNLTILQEPGKKHSISSNTHLDNLFYVKPNGALTLGSTSSDPVILDGCNINAYGSVISSYGTLSIKNANITSPNGRGIVCDTIVFENGQIYNCRYEGISVYTEGTILNGVFSNCQYGLFAHPESSVTIQNGEYTNNQTAVYSKGNCAIYGGCFSNCEYMLQSSSCGSITFSGGILSDAGCYALDVSNGGSIYFTGGEIRNSRSTTYPAPDKNVQGNLYVSGSPYMDKTSFIYCRTGSPVIQTGALTAPSNHPDAKLQIAAYSQDTPSVIPVSEDIQMDNEKDWYLPYDSSYHFVVIDNKLYAEGYVSPYNGQLPTVRPDDTSNILEETDIPASSAPASTIHATKTHMPCQSISPTYSTAPVNPTPISTVDSSSSPSCTPIYNNDSLPQLDYSTFVQTTPTITKITSEGLSFQLTWNFDYILSPDNYRIYYSTDKKHYSLRKTLKGSLTTATLSIPKARKGRRIYFYVVATISSEDTTYKSKKSNIVSKYLLPKVTGTSISYHANTDKLRVTWHKTTNCTGYHIYIKAKSNGITFEKKCATVSNSRHNTSISASKIKRLFSQNGKPVHIKGCYVRAYYKSGNKIAYSP